MNLVKRNRTETIQRIVKALEELIAEQGLAGAGINRVARKAGVSKALIYRYFGSLDSLISYYVKMGKLFPAFSAETLDQIRPIQKSDLAPIWHRQVLQLYRSFRASKTARELLKATVAENNVTACVVSQAVDEEMTRLVEQLSFVKGTDSKAVSAVIFGAMSYLTIMAQNNQPMIGLDLRSEKDWKRIEEAVKLIFIGINKIAVVSEKITIEEQRPISPTIKWQ